MAQEVPAPVLAPDPSLAVAKLTKDGDALYLKGDYEAARLAFAGAWELAQQTPPEDPVHYGILKRLSSVRGAVGEFADADRWLQQAIAWREGTMGPRDHKIADDLLLSVGFRRAMKDYDRALAILWRVQRQHVEAYTGESTMVADDLSRMGMVYAELKRADAAIASTNDAVFLRTRLSGPLDPSLIPDLDRLGEYHTAARDYEQAEVAYRHALVIRETQYGKTHAELISDVDGLAYALFGQKKYAEAEAAYRRLLGLWEANVGKNHVMVAAVLDKLAAFYAAQKKNDAVDEALERSTAIRARFLAMGLSEQATQAFDEGRLDQVKTVLQRGLGVLEPPGAANQDLRTQFEGMLKTLEATPKPPGPPPAPPGAPSSGTTPKSPAPPRKAPGA